MSNVPDTICDLGYCSSFVDCVLYLHQNDVGAGFSETYGHGGADATGGASYDGCFSLKGKKRKVRSHLEGVGDRDCVVEVRWDVLSTLYDLSGEIRSAQLGILYRRSFSHLVSTLPTQRWVVTVSRHNRVLMKPYVLVLD